MKITWFLVALFWITSDFGYCHEFAPSLLKINELPQVTEERSRYSAVLKTPSRPDGLPMLTPEWPSSCETDRQTRVQAAGATTVSNFLLSCSFTSQSLSGKTIGVKGLGDTQTSAVVIVNLRDSRRYQEVLSVGKSKFVVPHRMDVFSVLTAYSKLGLAHILSGIDHLMFVFGLMLLIVGVKQLVFTITAFTIGHSITLAIITLGFIPESSGLIEFAIALSIFFLAIELSRDSEVRNLWRHPWLLAGGFGLLHGLGFAGALLEFGLPQESIFLSLVAFNIGIELGQLSFMVLIFILWFMAKSASLDLIRYSRQVSIYLLGGFSVMWCIERGMHWLV